MDHISNVKVRIGDRFAYMRKEGLFFDKKDEKSRSRTQQQFGKEADINNIMAKYRKTGVLVDPTMVNVNMKPMFGDFTKLGSFQSMQFKVKEAEKAFNSLPLKVRQRFEFDPGKMLDFLSDPNNAKEAVELGLMHSSVIPREEEVLPEGKEQVVDKPVEKVEQPV